jgi:hypothetical protein
MLESCQVETKRPEGDAFRPLAQPHAVFRSAAYDLRQAFPGSDNRRVPISLKAR